MPGRAHLLGPSPGASLGGGAGRWPAWAQNLGLSLVSVVVCGALLLALELVARATAPSVSDPGADSVYDGHLFSQRLGWVPRPGAAFDVGGAHTTINALGYRGPAVNPDDAQRAKLVVLGDSVAFGYGVADGLTFSALLDDALPDLDVVNLAVPGYGIDQDVLRFESEGRRYRPRIVLLNVCIANDLADVMLSRFLYDGVHPKPYFKLAGGRLVLHDEHLRLGWFELLGVRLRERSFAYRRLRASLAPAAPAAAEAEVDWIARRREVLADPAEAHRLVIALVARLRQVVEADGGKLLLVVHPTKEAFRLGRSWIDELSAPREWAGLRVVDLGHSYHESGLGFGAFSLDWLGHLNATGHRLAAAALKAELQRAGP